MPDPRFARLKTDPRFRKPRKVTKKIVVDDRFKSIFDDGSKKDKVKNKSLKVDKYGRRISATHDSENLRRFYRLEDEAEDTPGAEKPAPDYARGEVLMESSDEDDERVRDSESDDGEVVLGRDIREPIPVPEDELEVDLDESRFAELDAQAIVNATKEKADNASGAVSEGERTNRLAVVNLDWDHVRASHLFKIASSVVSPTLSARNGRDTGGVARLTNSKILHVRVYPSEFGKKRLLQEEKEGPPKELFKKREQDDDADINERTLLQEDDGNEYNEEALRKYQLERLRYYYAIITCDTVDTASHIYSELDGTELERSANVFNLSFVPNDMSFDAEFRDEATGALSETYKGVEFVTDALRHSKVKLTWDDDDPERSKVTRRTLSRKEIEESDFKVYLASSSSEDDSLDVERPTTNKRNKLRELLLGGADENELLPEGWGKEVDKAGEMEITFTPGLSGKDDADGGDETTLQQYIRKQKDKRKQRKAERNNKEKSVEEEAEQDGFFGEDSDEEKTGSLQKPSHNARDGKSPPRKHVASSTAELELLVTSARPDAQHFDMRSVINAEKSKKKGRKEKKKRKDGRLDEDEAQEDFVINVSDDRFKALHDDHVFAIDPTNPHFKKTKSMTALLEERAKRQQETKVPDGGQVVSPHDQAGERSLKSLIENVKRKSVNRGGGEGKRRKLQ